MIHIATATDGAYLPWAATAFYSVLQHNAAGGVTFHLLLLDDLPSTGAEELARFLRTEGASIELHVVAAERVAVNDSGDRFGAIVLLRFLLPDLLPDVERVLYVDADTFTTASLEPLWKTAMGGAPIAAVANVVEPRMHAHLRALGISDPKRFFNSGVLLMNLGALRAEGASETLLRLTAENRDRLVWPDQDVLNIAFGDRWHALHPRWNTMNSLFTWTGWANDVFGPDAVQEALASPGILHFEGPSLCKPWHYLCNHPWRDAYRQTLAATPWAATPLEERTLGTQLIARLPERYRNRAYWELQRLRKRVGARSSNT